MKNSELKWTTALKTTCLAAAALALAAQPACAQYTLVDDFESYTVGTYSAGSTAFVGNGGPWQSSNGGATGLVSIKNDGDNYLAWGWNAGVRGANRAVTPIVDGGIGTYYFQISTTDATPDTSYGLSDLTTGARGAFGDFEVQVALTYSAADGIRVGARNGATTALSLVTGLSVNTWYDVWVEVNNAANTYNVYFGQTGDPNILGSLIATDFGFRNGAAANDLVTFMTLANNHEDNNANLDNIYYNPMAVPEPTTAVLLLGGVVALVGCRRRGAKA
jgi:hypothetical protein